MASPIARQYTRLLSLWPKDALRPTLPFTRALEHRALPFGVKPVEPAVEAKYPTAASSSTSPPAPSPSPSPSLAQNPRLEQAQVNALYSLLENRYSHKYTLSPGVLKPTSAPEHYDRLLAEIEKAPRKTWWQAKVDQWKMKIRWS